MDYIIQLRNKYNSLEDLLTNEKHLDNEEIIDGFIILQHMDTTNFPKTKHTKRQIELVT